MHDEPPTKVGKAVWELQACERLTFEGEDWKEVKIGELIEGDKQVYGG